MLFYLFLSEPVCCNLAYLLFLESGEETLHSGIFEAMSIPLGLWIIPFFFNSSLNASLVYWLPRSECSIAYFRILQAAFSCLTVSIHSSIFMLLRISGATILPLKQSVTGDTYSFPSRHCISVMSVRNYFMGVSALKYTVYYSKKSIVHSKMLNLLN